MNKSLTKVLHDCAKCKTPFTMGNVGRETYYAFHAAVSFSPISGPQLDVPAYEQLDKVEMLRWERAGEQAILFASKHEGRISEGDRKSVV